MKLWKVSPWIVGLALAWFAIWPRHTHAFGGLWSSQREPVQHVSERVLFIDNPDSTITAIIQVAYSGPAQKFAWLIPVPGEPQVSVSSNVVFERLNSATQPQYWLEVGHDAACVQPMPAEGSDMRPMIIPPPITAPVAIVASGVVGPYEYVNLAVDTGADDPARAASEWLQANGYDLTDVNTDVLGSYLKDGLQLLALKLTSATDAGALQPLMLTYDAAQPMIPLRATAVSARDDMPLQVWVLGPSQAVPTNYAGLVLDDARIDWLTAGLYSAGTLPAGGVGPAAPPIDPPDNYMAVVGAAANEAEGHGFVTELGAPASQYRDKIWAPLDQQTFDLLSMQIFETGIDALLSVQTEYSSWDGWNDAVRAATTLPASVSLHDFMANPEGYRDVARVDTAKLFEALQEKVIGPIASTAQLLYNAPYLTRLYTTLSAGEMTVDPTFDYNPDLAQISNIHVAKQFVACEEDNDASWRVELPQGGVLLGAHDSWPSSTEALPANLKIVSLSNSGPGHVTTDNSEHISMTLFGADVMDRASHLRPPHDGLLIGGTQTVSPFVAPVASPSQDAKPKPAASGCSVSRACGSSGSALWLGLGLFALRRRRARAWLAASLLAACSSHEQVPVMPVTPTTGGAPAALAPGELSREQLQDPESCKGCHPSHYREWSSSMHAYAAQDPVFIAMNKRGQRETNGELGDFCIKCHAPMAVVDKRSKDGLNLDQLPDKNRGVSCYFCHNVVGTDGDHNAMLRLANDTTMRGPLKDPLQPPAHGVEFSNTFIDTRPESTSMCGGCHDIVMPNGVHLERTFEEYRANLFSKSGDSAPPAFDSCVGCHMPGTTGFAAVAPAGAPQRTVHEHLWPGVDVPLTEFPNRAAMRSAVEDCQLGVASVSFFTLEVTPPDLFTFQFETSAGHNQPSGAAQDRRMWLEFMAYDENGKLLEEASSGNIADGQIEDDLVRDPHLLLFRDRIYGAKGEQVHMFWDAAKSKQHPEGYETNLLPAPSTTYVEGKRAILKQYRASGPNGLPARVTARLRMRPVGMDVLQDLVKSGDLDPAIVGQVPTMNFKAQIDWTPEQGTLKPIAATPKSDCSSYHCMLDPTSPACAQ